MNTGGRLAGVIRILVLVVFFFGLSFAGRRREGRGVLSDWEM